ncbi:hypothetical protein PGTUg99_032777 [Puccinia graminis f. sp. tritici]|uniref:Uncharacterized protein n=1 Tax=Puccinia graminis f. sp. tritici TaxID=56615 RepID=A0A5B0MIM6_PUCGR|nr:hypothetical protein PGTUg99_032777 [Puccinia graminis f. sp. tritici]
MPPTSPSLSALPPPHPPTSPKTASLHGHSTSNLIPLASRSPLLTGAVHPPISPSQTARTSVKRPPSQSPLAPQNPISSSHGPDWPTCSRVTEPTIIVVPHPRASNNPSHDGCPRPTSRRANSTSKRTLPSRKTDPAIAGARVWWAQIRPIAAHRSRP